MALTVHRGGQSLYQGEILESAEAMRRAGIPLMEPEAKEGLALTNGTALMTAIGALTVHKARQLADIADHRGAMSIEALQGTPLAFDPRMHQARPHRGQIASRRTPRLLDRLAADAQL